MSGVVQGHQLGSLLFGTTALVFLMSVYANRTFSKGSRDDLLQTGKEAEPTDSNKIPKRWNQDGEHLY